MSDDQLVWSDEHGDMRKKGKKDAHDIDVVESELELKIRRLTSGKGRTIIEITDLPQNKNWCKKLARELKKSLGVGGAYKNDFIEIHGEQIEKVIIFFEARNLKFKKIGG